MKKHGKTRKNTLNSQTKYDFFSFCVRCYNNANKQLKFSAGETELHTFTGESGTNYKEYSFEPSFTADTTVTITNPGSSSANCKYLVVAAPTSPETIPVTKITISTADTVRVGGRIALTATVEPENATKQTVDWSLPEGETNATISGGKLLGVGAGTVTVTASAKDESGVTATKNITITAAATASVTNEALGLTAAEVSGSDTVATGAKTDTGVTFTAVAPGEATATVKDAANNTATVTVTVAEDGAVTAEVKEAYSENGATVKYHVYAATTDTKSAAADTSNDKIIMGSDFVVTEGSAFGDENKTVSIGNIKSVALQTGDKTSFYGVEYETSSKLYAPEDNKTEDDKYYYTEAGDNLQNIEFTLTAKQALTVDSISTMMITGSTSAVKWSLYLNDSETASATATGKDGVIKAENLKKHLSADETLKVSIKIDCNGYWNTTSSGVAPDTSGKKFKITVGEISVKTTAE